MVGVKTRPWTRIAERSGASNTSLVALLIRIYGFLRLYIDKFTPEELSHSQYTNIYNSFIEYNSISASKDKQKISAINNSDNAITTDDI